VNANFAQQLSLRALLIHAATQLAPQSDSALLDAELLLAHVLDQSRSYLLTHADARPDAPTVQRYAELIEQRAAGKPLAYLTGEREFWSLPLTITPAVLVPRPETELVVERCLALLPDASAQIADLGTGSGAIALALASERPHWLVLATDISAEALDVARANAQRLALKNLQFLLGPWFSPLPRRRYALIASNPPYIAADDAALGQPALSHEPRLALTPGASGLEALSQIIAGAEGYLADAGHLVLEHGAGQAEEVGKMLVHAGFANVRCYCDLAGRDRVTQAQKI
jgi:release factor glutamine methyltransferase